MTVPLIIALAPHAVAGGAPLVHEPRGSAGAALLPRAGAFRPGLPGQQGRELEARIGHRRDQLLQGRPPRRQGLLAHIAPGRLDQVKGVLC
jgi:hypothetical protein